MSVIEFFRLQLSDIINESFWSLQRVHSWKLTVPWLFYSMSHFFHVDKWSFFVCGTSFFFFKCHLVQSFYKASVSHWICYRLWCVRRCFSFVGCCIEAGLSALVELLFTPMFSTLPWPLLHFQRPEKNMSLWTLTPPWSTSTLHQEAKHMPEQLTPALPSI